MPCDSILETRHHDRVDRMKTQLKKSTYLFGIFFVGLVMVLLHDQFSPQDSMTRDHASLTLKPFTAREQKDLIQAQVQEDQLDVSGPLIAKMNATDAQARVLNLNRGVKSTG